MLSRVCPLSDAILIAVSQLVDDSQSERRDPSHSDLRFAFEQHGLLMGDPAVRGQSIGKAKRVRSTLSWALEHAPDAGAQFVETFIALIRGHGGFRECSPNYVGAHAFQNAAAVFASEGYELSLDGDLRPRLLDGLSGLELPDALNAYVRRAKRGAADAALVTGTGKDLLEAVAAHVLQQRYGSYAATSNFPTLLGQVFVALGLATPQDPVIPGEPPQRRIERALYELACGINQLRNKAGTGHGRPWAPAVTAAEARMAIEHMGIISEWLLLVHRGA
jgi:Abortive infection C-terminus